MNAKYKLITLAVMSAMLTACAGGGGGNTPDTQSTNTPTNQTGTNNNSNGTNNNGNQNAGNANTSSYKNLSEQDKAEARAGKGAYIGVIDTGINANAKGLAGKNVSQKTVNGSSLIDSKDGAEHGTAMAEIMVQTAPNVAINSGGNSSGNAVYAQTGADNLLRAMEAGAKVDVLNNSYGPYVTSDNPSEVYGANNSKLIERNKTMGKLYQEFVERDVLVVTITGNEDKKVASLNAALPLVNPELEKGFIAVTGYNQRTASKTQNECDLTMNYCLTAPEVYNVYATGSEKVAIGGTSSAGAYVSALAARLKSRYDWYSAENLKDTLLTTADDRGAAGVDAIWGHGLVNAEKSLNGYGRFDKQVTLNVAGSKKAYFFDNDISGTGGLTKKGRDILVMNGNNTYTGNTRIEQGELVANGNSVSKHIVSSGASLTIGDNAQGVTLGAVQNAGKLSVEAANLNVTGDLDNRNGSIHQAIGTQIKVAGSANLNNSQYIITGTKQGYTTKAGSTEVLLHADKGISSNGLITSFANTTVGELINRTINVANDKITVTTSRSAIGDVVRNQADFKGRDRAVKDLDGLLDKVDANQIPNAINYNYQTPEKVGNDVIDALLSSQNISKTLFAMSSETAKHAQEQSVREKGLRGDKAIVNALTAQEKGSVWIDAGFGKTKASGLSDVNGESRNDSQTLGVSKSFGNHGLSAQINRVSHRWTESYQGLEKTTDTTGYGFETGYTYNQGSYWLGATVGYDRLKAESVYGSDTGNQFLFGVSAGKLFDFGRFSLMPSVGLKYTQLSDLDYTVGKVGNSHIVAENVKTREAGATVGLDGFWQVDSQGKWKLNAGLKLYQMLHGKTTYTANYGGYKVAVNDKISGNRPDVAVNAGATYQATDNLRVFLNGSYEKGKYRDRKGVNIGLGLSF